ncbi:hypothetical protein [Nonomuraea sp. NPDC049695]|uniref:hypothetical protein n=1 Tax=Nonomuraea sp. NPDC049695 TaxID=3154734 RepID=UPI0034380A2F
MGSGYQYGGSLGGVEIQFKKGKIENLGQDLSEQAPAVGNIARNTGGIRVDPPAFGLIGVGLNYAHDRVKDGAASALDTAKTVLQDYKDALSKLDKNYQKADEDSDGKINTGGTGPGTGPGLGGGGIKPASMKTPKMPGAGDLPKTNMPGTGDLPKTDLPKTDLPKTDLPKTDLPKTDLPNSNLPDPNLPGSNLPQANVPNPNIPDTNLPDPNANLPKTPSIEDQLNHNVPTVDPKTLQVDPTKTNLSSFDPSKLGTIPINPNTATTTIGPGPGMSTGTGSGPTVAGPGTAAPAAAGARGGMTGMGGMPYGPMMGGGAGGEQNKERDKPDYVRGNEEDWMDDVDIAPQVIGEEA